MINYGMCVRGYLKNVELVDALVLPTHTDEQNHTRAGIELSPNGDTLYVSEHWERDDHEHDDGDGDGSTCIRILFHQSIDQFLHWCELVLLHQIKFLRQTKSTSGVRGGIADVECRCVWA